MIMEKMYTTSATAPKITVARTQGVCVYYIAISEASPVESTEMGEEQLYEYNAVAVTLDHEIGEDDYGAVVSAVVRAKYSEDSVEAIVQNYIASKTAEHKAEWQALQDWRATAKALAREALGL